MLLTGKNDTTYQDRVCRLLGVDPRQAMAHYSALSLLLGGVITVKEPAPAPSTDTGADDDDGQDKDTNRPDTAEGDGETVEPGLVTPSDGRDRYW